LDIGQVVPRSLLPPVSLRVSPLAGVLVFWGCSFLVFFVTGFSDGSLLFFFFLGSPRGLVRPLQNPFPQTRERRFLFLNSLPRRASPSCPFPYLGINKALNSPSPVSLFLTMDILFSVSVVKILVVADFLPRVSHLHRFGITPHLSPSSLVEMLRLPFPMSLAIRRRARLMFPHFFPSFPEVPLNRPVPLSYSGQFFVHSFLFSARFGFRLHPPPPIWCSLSAITHAQRRYPFFDALPLRPHGKP